MGYSFFAEAKYLGGSSDDISKLEVYFLLYDLVAHVSSSMFVIQLSCK